MCMKTNKIDDFDADAVRKNKLKNQLKLVDYPE